MVKNLLNLFFPKVCLACNYTLMDNEKYICTLCRHELPVTNYHNESSNAVKNILYGRVQLENATSLLHFSKKGRVQQMMHNLKYRGFEDVGIVLGRWLGAELSDIEEYQSIDVVIPVPLHKSRLRKRGYNQVSKFGREIALALNAEYNENVLAKTAASRTQVFKDRLTRSTEISFKFRLINSQAINGKHILLVDDIITTGSTIEACANELLKASDVRISLATMAITD